MLYGWMVDNNPIIIIFWPSVGMADKESKKVQADKESKKVKADKRDLSKLKN